MSQLIGEWIESTTSIWTEWVRPSSDHFNESISHRRCLDSEDKLKTTHWRCWTSRGGGWKHVQLELSLIIGMETRSLAWNNGVINGFAGHCRYLEEESGQWMTTTNNEMKGSFLRREFQWRNGQSNLLEFSFSLCYYFSLSVSTSVRFGHPMTFA